MDLMDNSRIDTDVLVIGGGGAGLTAAIEARKKGADVLILCKRDTGRAAAPYAVTTSRVRLRTRAGSSSARWWKSENPRSNLDVFVRGSRLVTCSSMVYLFPSLTAAIT
jgi:glycine/D-amino acid oxidase-like deaminating enzyme